MHRTKPTKSPIPSLPQEQAPRQPTTGLSGTRWLEELFCGKQPKSPLLISTFDSSEVTLPPFLQPSHPNEPPIPGPSQSLELQEDVWTCEPEPEVAATQSTEEPFGKPPLYSLTLTSFSSPLL
ncbi:hypothetical protein O181_009657 [Austropuccinia psidii MF-1]|uniref:Uncharacterized protein n=1 Tax=Austropuccinia psidii MF-1 TaxID=1389203 RepID=A0A9Q3BR56_9BASI|nr:hypothetical protein [Austropuccinia psidii MF-1]